MSGARDMRVLFVNQSVEMSGAERSLLDLLTGLRDGISPAVATPEGPLADELRSRDVPVITIPRTDVSFRLHPVHTPRGLAWFARTGLHLRALARKRGADVVHANSARAGLAACVARRLGAPPTIVHLRDWVPSGRMADYTLRSIERHADAIVANSRFVAEQLPDVRAGCRVEVVHNPVDTGRFDPTRIGRVTARERLGLDPDVPVLAVVAQFTPWKGQDDAIRVVAALRSEVPRPRLLLAGSAKFTAPSARFDSRAYEREIRELPRALGVDDAVVFLGERDDVPMLLAATDVLLVPSWREAFGRIALEAMAMEVPVVATAVGGPREIVRDGVDGLILEPRRPEAWAEAVSGLIADPDRRRSMGRQGRKRALEHFGIDRHAEDIVRLYERIAESELPTR